MILKCMACGFVSHNTEMVIVYDPNRPKGAKKKNYILGVICDNEKCRREYENKNKFCN